MEVGARESRAGSKQSTRSEERETKLASARRHEAVRKYPENHVADGRSSKQHEDQIIT